MASSFPTDRSEKLPKGTQASGTGRGDCQSRSPVIHLQHPAGNPAFGATGEPFHSPPARGLIAVRGRALQPLAFSKGQLGLP